MPQFDYVAKDPSGKLKTGSVHATTEGDAVRALQAQGYSVSSLAGQTTIATAAPQEAYRPREPLLPSIFHRLRARELSIFFRELYTMLNAGVSLVRALELQSQTTVNPQLRRIIRDLSTRVQSGEKLSLALEGHGRVFDKLVLGLVRAGEATGGLDRMCLLLADYLEKEYQLREKIKRETFYPKIVGLGILFIPSVPTLVVKGFGAWISEMLGYAAVAAPFVIGAAVLWFASRKYRQTATGRSTLDGIKLRLPLFGKVIQRLSLSKFCRTLAALYKAGIGYAQALPTAAEACGNQVIADTIRSAGLRVQEGEKLSAVLQRSRHFHPMVLQMILTGEETGNMDAMLDKVADYFESEADTAIHQMTVMITPILIVIGGIFVAMKVISFYTGMFNGILNF